MTPVDADHALTSVLLGEVQVALKSVHVELRQPHRGIVFQPRNRPTLTSSEFAEDFVHGIPAERIAEAREHDVSREVSMEVFKVPRDTAPAAQDQAFLRRVALQEI